MSDHGNRNDLSASATPETTHSPTASQGANTTSSSEMGKNAQDTSKSSETHQKTQTSSQEHTSNVGQDYMEDIKPVSVDLFSRTHGMNEGDYLYGSKAATEAQPDPKGDFMFTGHGDERLHTDPGAQGQVSQTSGEGNARETGKPEAGSEQFYGGFGDHSFVYEDTYSASARTVPESLTIFDSSVDLGETNLIANDFIDLDSALDNYLSVSAEDVLSMSDTNNPLIIDGTKHDAVNLEGDWNKGESVDGYTTFTSGEASISIDDHIVNAGGVIII